MYRYRFYEIGLSGTAEQVEEFGKVIRERDENFWSGTYREDTKRSFQRFIGYTDDVVLTDIQETARKYSLDFQGAETFYYVESQETVGRSRFSNTTITYGSYVGGSPTGSDTIKTHAQHKVHYYGLKDCDCENIRVKNDPTFAPYPDCPSRVDPPTVWAVENILEANEYIGRR